MKRYNEQNRSHSSFLFDLFSITNEIIFFVFLVHFLTNKSKMSSPQIALTISSSPSENKTTCHFDVESMEFYTNPD